VKPELTTTTITSADLPSSATATAPTPGSTTSNPKFFLGDDDSNSSTSSSDASLYESETSSKPTIVTTTQSSLKSENGPTDKQATDANKLLADKTFGFNKLNQIQVASSSWPSLKKNTPAVITASNPSSTRNAASVKSGPVENKQLEEQENLKTLKEQVMPK
jgi:hypothetical protein